jgi:hypothetical protein
MMTQKIQLNVFCYPLTTIAILKPLDLEGLSPDWKSITARVIDKIDSYKAGSL